MIFQLNLITKICKFIKKNKKNIKSIILKKLLEFNDNLLTLKI